MSTGEQEAPDPARVLEWARGWARLVHAMHRSVHDGGGLLATCSTLTCIEAREVLWPGGLPDGR